MQSRLEVSWIRSKYCGGKCLKCVTTVDGRNPAPPGIYKTLQLMGFLTYQLVQDFFHQQQLPSNYGGTYPLKTGSLENHGLKKVAGKRWYKYAGTTPHPVINSHCQDYAIFSRESLLDLINLHLISFVTVAGWRVDFFPVCHLSKWSLDSGILFPGGGVQRPGVMYASRKDSVRNPVASFPGTPGPR